MFVWGGVDVFAYAHVWACVCVWDTCVHMHTHMRTCAHVWMSKDDIVSIPWAVSLHLTQWASQLYPELSSRCSRVRQIALGIPGSPAWVQELKADIAPTKDFRELWGSKLWSSRLQIAQEMLSLLSRPPQPLSVLILECIWPNFSEQNDEWPSKGYYYSRVLGFQIFCLNYFRMFITLCIISIYLICTPSH